jgi:hypothetical protein
LGEVGERNIPDKTASVFGGLLEQATVTQELAYKELSEPSVSTRPGVTESSLANETPAGAGLG